MTETANHIYWLLGSLKGSWQTYSGIAKLVGCSRSTAIRSIGWLRKHKLCSGFTPLDASPEQLSWWADRVTAQPKPVVTVSTPKPQPKLKAVELPHFTMPGEQWEEFNKWSAKLSPQLIAGGYSREATNDIFETLAQYLGTITDIKLLKETIWWMFVADQFQAEWRDAQANKGADYTTSSGLLKSRIPLLFQEVKKSAAVA